MSCSHHVPHDNATFFGLKQLKFGSEVGFADVLYSITDNQRLFRGDYLRYTSDFGMMIVFLMALGGLM